MQPFGHNLFSILNLSAFSIGIQGEVVLTIPTPFKVIVKFFLASALPF
jgi:hypothetical protein